MQDSFLSSPTPTNPDGPKSRVSHHSRETMTDPLTDPWSTLEALGCERLKKGSRPAPSNNYPWWMRDMKCGLCGLLTLQEGWHQGFLRCDPYLSTNYTKYGVNKGKMEASTDPVRESGIRKSRTFHWIEETEKWRSRNELTFPIGCLTVYCLVCPPPITNKYSTVVRASTSCLN